MRSFKSFNHTQASMITCILFVWSDTSTCTDQKTWLHGASEIEDPRHTIQHESEPGTSQPGVDVD